MKTYKEYPATHSMSTAWYCVDEDDNVAIFSCKDNGPKPHGVEDDSSISELCFDTPITEKNGMRQFNFTDEQLLEFLEGNWLTKVDKRQLWYDVIVQIDINRENDFFTYLAKARHWLERKCLSKKLQNEIDATDFVPVCFSKKYGIYRVSLSSYFSMRDGLRNRHAKFLLENKIVLRFCEKPLWIEEKDEFVKGIPYYIYLNDWDSSLPHKRRNLPYKPMKLAQMPQSIVGNIIRLPLRFPENENIQIAEKTLCYSSSWLLDAYNGFFYAKAVMPSGEECYILTDDTSTDPKLEKSDSEIAERWKSPLRILPQSEVEELLKREHNQYLLYD